MTIIQNRFNYYHHFTNEETETLRSYIAYPEIDLVLELGRFFAYMIFVKVRAQEDLNSKIRVSLSRFVSQHNGTG